MSIYIRINGDHVELAGQEATQSMIDAGYFLYHGEVPPCPFLKWDSSTNSLVENFELQSSIELSELRAKRDRLLQESDWVVLRAYELNASVPDEWLLYRQQLRDLPNRYSPNTLLIFPTKPNSSADVLMHPPTPAKLNLG